MKVWTNNQFTGHWPVGTAAVVVAKTAKDAAEFLNILLRDLGLPGDANEEAMEPVKMKEGVVVILNDGDY